MERRQVFITSMFKSLFKGEYGKRRMVTDLLDEKDADEIDAMIFGLQTLAEELNDTTISRDYFNGIFNSTSEIMLILSGRGIIEDVNQAVCIQLEYEKGQLVGRPVGCLTGKASPSLFNAIRKTREGSSAQIGYWRLLTAMGGSIPVVMTVTVMSPVPNRRVRKILLMAKDITAQLAAENRVLRSMIDAQEQERFRLARDLHDSLGQQISAIKFLVSTAAKQSVDAGQLEHLLAANKTLAGILAETRNICFNLMPKTLEDFGLLQAIRELCEHVGRPGGLGFSVRSSPHFLTLPKELEIDLFRVVQEFVQNALKHGEARNVRLSFQLSSGNVELKMEDNGKGFDTRLGSGQGTGLRNMQGRIKSHNGIFRLRSRPGKGTRVVINVPVTSLVPARPSG